LAEAKMLGQFAFMRRWGVGGGSICPLKEARKKVDCLWGLIAVFLHRLATGKAPYEGT